MSFAVLDPIGVRIIGTAQTEEKVIVLVEGQTQSINAASGAAVIFHPAGHHDFFSDLLVSVLSEERNLAVTHDVESFRPPDHRQRSP